MTTENDPQNIKTLTNELFDELDEFHVETPLGHHYYYQQLAVHNLPRMPTRVPTPPFEIDLNHLSIDLRKELATFKTAYGSRQLRTLLNEAVGRLFENINQDARSTIKPILWVRIVDENKNESKGNDSLIGDYDNVTVEARHITETFNSVKDPIQFICDTLGKEVKAYSVMNMLFHLLVRLKRLCSTGEEHW